LSCLLKAPALKNFCSLKFDSDFGIPGLETDSDSENGLSDNLDDDASKASPKSTVSEMKIIPHLEEHPTILVVPFSKYQKEERD